MNPNPYEPPRGADAADMVDRAGRAALAATIRRYLDERISSFQFDEALDEFRDSSDSTVRLIAFAAWFWHDDVRDHLIVLSKPEWDYIQRILLVLDSDRRIVTASVPRWSWTQFLAAGCLAVFAGCAWRFGWGPQLLVYSIPFGLVSIVISFLRRRGDAARATQHQILAPFSSFSELESTYRATAGFTKKRYPRALARRRVRSPVAESVLMLPTYAAWLLLAPIPLLAQSLPATETRTSVTVAAGR